jgi:hypothetical protein
MFCDCELFGMRNYTSAIGLEDVLGRARLFNIYVDIRDGTLFASTCNTGITHEQFEKALSPEGEFGRFAGNITKLELFRCERLRALPDLSRLTSLKTLKILQCPKLRMGPTLSGLANLQKLVISECLCLDTVIDDVLFLHEPVNIKKILIQRCPAIRDIQFAPWLAHLEKFQVADCKNLNSLIFPELPLLKEINIGGCSHLNILDLSRLSGLRTLNIKRCNLKRTSCSVIDYLLSRELRRSREIDGLFVFSLPSNLVELCIEECPWAKDCSQLGELSSLEVLCLNNTVVELPEWLFQLLPHLRRLSLGDPFCTLTRGIDQDLEIKASSYLSTNEDVVRLIDATREEQAKLRPASDEAGSSDGAPAKKRARRTAQE